MDFEAMQDLRKQKEAEGIRALRFDTTELRNTCSSYLRTSCRSPGRRSVRFANRFFVTRILQRATFIRSRLVTVRYKPVDSYAPRKWNKGLLYNRKHAETRIDAGDSRKVNHQNTFVGARKFVT